MNLEIQKLIERLQRIARKNEDEFRYSIDIEPPRRGVIVFVFNVTERADGHSFIAAEADTLEKLIANAEAQIPSALEEWGYEE
jgi:hypothetical protein